MSTCTGVQLSLTLTTYCYHVSDFFSLPGFCLIFFSHTKFQKTVCVSTLIATLKAARPFGSGISNSSQMEFQFYHPPNGVQSKLLASALNVHP